MGTLTENVAVARSTDLKEEQFPRATGVLPLGRRSRYEKKKGSPDKWTRKNARSSSPKKKGKRKKKGGRGASFSARSRLSRREGISPLSGGKRSTSLVKEALEGEEGVDPVVAGRGTAP